MVRAVWRNRIGPPSVVLGLALLLSAAITASAAIAAASRHSSGLVGSCPDSPGKAAGAAQRDAAQESRTTTTELRLSPRGELIGRVLRLRGGFSEAAIALPVESFVGPQAGSAVVYTRSGGGRGSEVHLVDMETGCDTVIARPSEIVRSAILNSDASAVYVHSVMRGSRRDAGVARYDLASDAMTLVVPALHPVQRTGPIHGTELRWSVDGGALTVQSCGFAECTSRVLDVATGELVRVDGAGQGALIGTTRDYLITFATCPGLPCSVSSFDLESGARNVVATEAFGASVGGGSGGRVLLSIATAHGDVEVEL